MSWLTAKPYSLYSIPRAWLALSGEMQQRLPFRWRQRKGYRGRVYRIPP